MSTLDTIVMHLACFCLGYLGAMLIVEWLTRLTR